MGLFAPYNGRVPYSPLPSFAFCRFAVSADIVYFGGVVCSFDIAKTAKTAHYFTYSGTQQRTKPTINILHRNARQLAPTYISIYPYIHTNYILTKYLLTYYI